LATAEAISKHGPAASGRSIKRVPLRGTERSGAEHSSSIDCPGWLAAGSAMQASDGC